MTAPLEFDDMSPAGSKRRVALLGTGYIADWHAQSLKSVADVELAAVCDRILPRARAFAQRFGVQAVYGSLDEMLAHEALDAVHVLLPPNLHFEAARTCLLAGVHVFIEKPMCGRAADCDALTALASERGLRLGVGHNFLFAEPYQRLRRAVRSGVLGRIDHVTITWNRPLPQIVHGPFDIWMLRDPRNIMLEVGSHSAAHMLDLIGEPDTMEARAGNAIELPTGTRFYRRWQVSALKGQTAVELRFSFVPGFSEYRLHVRGSLAAATVDFERNTYVLAEHRPLDPDFESHAMVVSQAGELKRQARQTLSKYLRSKLRLTQRGNPYGESIARALDAFYEPAAELDERLSARLGARTIRICERIGELANLPAGASAAVGAAKPAVTPRILVLGGTGFIGRELVQQLTAAGRAVRLLVRSAANLPADLRGPLVELQVGDLMNRADVEPALDGIDSVLHLARAHVKSWADYREYEIGATQQLAECALAAGVKRFVYTGTIDSFYAGRRAGTITEQTPLDRKIARRNLYSRAKAASEELLRRMHRERGLPLVIARPGIVIGRGGSPFHWGIGMWWHDAVCQVWGAGTNKLPLVLVEDVASGLIAAMDKPGIEGRAFNLVADPCLSAQEYLDELDRAGGLRIQRHSTPIARFYLLDMLKWMVKVAVRHPDRRLPLYRNWESTTQRAVFDCTETKAALDWHPKSDRETMVRRGIEEPLMEAMR
jgi:predicted dehydrogenase/nucleoside-diphosphate-sugar epimerase